MSGTPEPIMINGVPTYIPAMTQLPVIPALPAGGDPMSELIAGMLPTMSTELEGEMAALTGKEAVYSGKLGSAMAQYAAADESGGQGLGDIVKTLTDMGGQAGEMGGGSGGMGQQMGSFGQLMQPAMQAMQGAGGGAPSGSGSSSGGQSSSGGSSPSDSGSSDTGQGQQEGPQELMEPMERYDRYDNAVPQHHSGSAPVAPPQGPYQHGGGDLAGKM